jgi:hypothetical protein
MNAAALRGPIVRSCFWALAALGGTADTSQLGGWLRRHGSDLTHEQLKGALWGLVHRDPPLVEVAVQGQAGSGKPNVWRLTAAGRAATGVDERVADLSAADVDRLRKWLGHPSGSVTSGRVTVEAVEGGGILVRVAPQPPG